MVLVRIVCDLDLHVLQGLQVWYYHLVLSQTPWMLSHLFDVNFIIMLFCKPVLRLYQTYWLLVHLFIIMVFCKPVLRLYHACVYGLWGPVTASREKGASDLPSNQPFSAHARPLSKVTSCPLVKFPLDLLLMWANSTGSGETALMRSLTWTFAVRICCNDSFPMDGLPYFCGIHNLYVILHAQLIDFQNCILRCSKIIMDILT